MCITRQTKDEIVELNVSIHNPCCLDPEKRPAGATLTRRSEAGEFKGVGHLNKRYANKKDGVSLLSSEILPMDTDPLLEPRTHKATRTSCPCRWHPEAFWGSRGTAEGGAILTSTPNRSKEGNIEALPAPTIMCRKRIPGNRHRGAALVLCMVMTAAALASICVISLRTVAHIRHSQYAEWRAAAFSGAELALASARNAMERGEEEIRGYYGDAASMLLGIKALPKMDDEQVVPQSFEGAPELRWYAIVGSPKSFSDDIVVILAVGEVHGVHAAVEGIYRRNAGSGALHRLTWRERTLQKEAP
ncbi:MAG: hypothetical protein L3K26_17705 [Candidatus Hydrogenedentes bacterium]|nr:hypothetical protein [Candidatus Hydrogenedentota bacterium]